MKRVRREDILINGEDMIFLVWKCECCEHIEKYSKLTCSECFANKPKEKRVAMTSYDEDDILRSTKHREDLRSYLEYLEKDSKRNFLGRLGAMGKEEREEYLDELFDDEVSKMQKEIYERRGKRDLVKLRDNFFEAIERILSKREARNFYSRLVGYRIANVDKYRNKIFAFALGYIDEFHMGEEMERQIESGKIEKSMYIEFEKIIK